MKSKLKKHILNILKCGQQLPVYWHINRPGMNRLALRVIAVLCAPLAFIFETLRKSQHKNQSHYENLMGLVAIIKDEGQYIREFIEYYRLIGYDKIILFDNESSDNTVQLLKPYIDEGLVDYYYINGKYRQKEAYNTALWKYKFRCKYLSFLDADEFIFSSKEHIVDLVEKLFSNNCNVGGVAANWQSYGSSGHRTRPDGLVIENYLYRASTDYDVDRHIKTIVNPRKTMYFPNPHFAIYKKGYHALNVMGDIVDGAESEAVIYEPLCVKHYFTKSMEEFEFKRLRGKADVAGIRAEDEFYKRDVNTLYDDSMIVFANIIKERLNLKGV